MATNDAWNAFYNLELCERDLRYARRALDEHQDKAVELEREIEEQEERVRATVAEILEQFEPIAEGTVIDCGTSHEPRLYRRTADGFERLKVVNVFRVQPRAEADPTPAEETAEFAVAS